MTAPLTKRQRSVYEFIESYIHEKGFGPTVREIAEAVNLSSPSTVHVHLKTLEEKGYIVRDPLKSRSIALPHSDESELSYGSEGFENALSLPLVGNVAAGEPILAEQNIETTMTLPTELVGDSASFILSHGDSMIEIGINDGDYVVVKQQNVAHNGEIVVALIDDGATVKRFYKEKDHIRLQPENSSMEPIITKDCAIVGKVVAVLRKVY